uniref:Uncharacterized protein n=1 Tax=viral metagenome TaxID=1070528 RepID=A0A6M3LBV8_9ZZZZ
MKKVTAYKCDFCKPNAPRLFLSHSGAKKHENRCWLNPARKSCATCMNVAPLSDISVGWKCLENIYTPFKKKVEGCSHYKPSGTIFDNETN